MHNAPENKTDTLHLTHPPIMPRRNHCINEPAPPHRTYGIFMQFCIITVTT